MKQYKTEKKKLEDTQPTIRLYVGLKEILCRLGITDERWYEMLRFVVFSLAKVFFFLCFKSLTFHTFNWKSYVLWQKEHLRLWHPFDIFRGYKEKKNKILYKEALGFLFKKKRIFPFLFIDFDLLFLFIFLQRG